MNQKLETANGIRYLDFSERFTFADSSEFRRTLMDYIALRPQVIVFNLGRLVQMDSAGLGMLLVAQKNCQDAGIQLQLTGVAGEVKHILEVTQCYDRFQII